MTMILTRFSWALHVNLLQGKHLVYFRRFDKRKYCHLEYVEWVLLLFRVGLKRDISDNRTCSFIHLLSIFPHLNTKWKYLVIENVKGFEKSEACETLIKILEDLDFCYQQFILSPSMFSIPNTRHRYYLIAKRRPLYFNFPLQPHVVSILF